MTRLLALTVLVALSGCADMSRVRDSYDTWGRGRADNRTDTRRDDVRRTPEYRRITSDAGSYARRITRDLRLDSQQERRIREVLADRTARLLQQTRVRDHRAVYPFPRRYDGRASRAFWASADRDITRLLGRRDGDAYSRYVRNGGRADSRYDDRSNRRYDDRDNDRNDDGERGRVRGDRDRDDDDR